jgi:hypothetical protein
MARRKRGPKARSADQRSVNPPPKARPKRAPQSVGPDGPDAAPGVDRWRPWLLGALVALLVVRPLYPSESAAWDGDGLVVVMLWIALAVFWLLGSVGRPRFELRLAWTDAAVLLLVGWHTIAALWVLDRGSPRPAVNMLWEWIAYGLCYLLARQLIVRRREMRAVVVVMIAVAVTLAVYGLYQYLWELPATRAEFEKHPDAALRDSQLWFEPGSREFELFRARLDTFRPMATFALTNSLAGYLAPWLVVTAGIGMIVGWSARRWRSWLAVVVCAVPVATCLYLTGSRTAQAATFLGVLLLALWWLLRGGARSGWRLGAAVAVGLMIYYFVLAAASVVADAGIFPEASKSFGYRIQYWQSTLRMIADHPMVGCGPGNFQSTYTQYMLPEASEEIADPHNFVMEVWATAGTPALVALLAVLGSFAYALLRGGRLQPSAARQPEVSRTTGQADATRHVLGGAACGFLLSVPVGQMSAAPPSVVDVVHLLVHDLPASLRLPEWLRLPASAEAAAPELWVPAVVLFGLPVAAVTVLLFWEWIHDGPLTPSLPAIGVVVLLVNLLAAGAMGFPGVFGTFWVLVAIGLNLTGASRSFAVPRSAALAALAAAMALALSCSATAFSPVLRSQTAVRLAQRDPGHAEQHLRDAADADPMAAAPRRYLAQRAFDHWLESGNEAAFDDFEAWMAAALDRAPRSASTWRMAADRYWQAVVEGGRDDALPKAVSAYRRAVDLYPSSALLRTRLAVALRRAGDETGFRQQAGMALKLDAQTPHRDRKLDPRVRDELRRALARSSSRDE